MNKNRVKYLARRAVENPVGVPRYLLRKVANYVAPQSRWARGWKREDGVITWQSFDWGAGDNAAEVGAINYHIYKSIEESIGGADYSQGLEIGCGYGRITPWVAEFCDETYGIDPNTEMIDVAERHHPDITFDVGKAQSLPYESDTFDLIFIRSVLQHIEDEELPPITAEIERVLTADGTLLLIENTDGETDHLHSTTRSVKEFDQLFSGFCLDSSEPMENPVLGENGKSIMRFTAK